MMSGTTVRNILLRYLVLLHPTYRHTLLVICNELHPYCSSTTETDFKLCGNHEGEQIRYKSRSINKISTLPPEHTANNSNGAPNKTSITTTTGTIRTGKTTTPIHECDASRICRHIFKVGRIYRLSFGAKISVQVAQMLQRCCGKCTVYHQTNLLPPLKSNNKSIIDTLDIIYPIYAFPIADKIQGFFFIPVLKVPSAFYFTRAKTEKDMAEDIIFGCLRMWPLLAMCIVLSLIAGILIWVLDTWSNRKQFPRSFPAGVREGFWWSFVSMTTVGYGDKSPKSLPGRIFAVLWILIGITVTSIYIASLASHVMAAQETEVAHIRGHTVGALQNRLYDSLMIAQHGGILHEIPFNKTFDGIIQLIEMLRDRKIDGFLVSRTTYYYFSRLMDEDPTLGADIRNFALKQTEKDFVGDHSNHLVAGMLVRRHDDYHFFREYFRSNWPHIQGCYSYDLNYKDKKFVQTRANPLQGLFMPFFIGSVSTLVLLFGMGVVYECVRRKNAGGELDNQVDDQPPKQGALAPMVNESNNGTSEGRDSTVNL